MRLESRGQYLFETTDFFEPVVNWLEQHCGPVSELLVHLILIVDLVINVLKILAKKLVALAAEQKNSSCFSNR
jgi:hypothetical protein